MLKNARWIKSPADAGAAVNTFKKTFYTAGGIKSATLYATSVGVYTAYVNGEKIGRGVLTPGFTSYDNRVLYQTYDVTPLITGENTLEIGVGQGWAVGYVGYGRKNHVFADHTSLKASIVIEYLNGTKETVSTDESWQVYTDSVTFAEIYHGETVDLTAPITLIGNALYDDSVTTETVMQDGEWIVERERLAAAKLIKTPKGETVIDFGQNMTGYVEVRIKGKRGERVEFCHAETLDSDGNFYKENLRSARNYMTYVLSGGEDVFKPRYSFQGFRYIRIEAYPDADIDLSAFCAVAVYSNMKRTGRFTTGNAKINQLYHNVIWGQRSNFLDIPTDCPQRDERLGWTGDAQVFCRTACINYDTKRFFTKWLRDVALEQTPDGAVYGIVPDALGGKNLTRISAAWGDCACIIPWQLYLAYGDRELLKEHFPMMKKWVEYQRSVGPEEFLWLTGYHYGDWLAMDAGEDSYVGATSTDLIASAFFAYSTKLLIKAGEVIGENVSEYRKLYENVKKAFREYFMSDGLPKESLPRTEIKQLNKSKTVDLLCRGVTQTAITLILHFGLYEECERRGLIEKLVQLIEENDGKMATGFVGTPYIMHVLSDNGYTDVAYKLLFNEENPSWLYSVCHGATTMWEHWNSIKEDGSFWSTDMNSLNHYAYGSVFDWIFGTSLGISPSEAEPAYKEIIFAPHPEEKLGFAEGSIDTMYGTVRAMWYFKDGQVYYELDVPKGAHAKVRLPSGYEAQLGEGTYHFVE